MTIVLVCNDYQEWPMSIYSTQINNTAKATKEQLRIIFIVLLRLFSCKEVFRKVFKQQITGLGGDT